MTARMPPTPPRECVRCGGQRAWVLCGGSYRPACQACIARKLDARRAEEEESARATYLRKRSTLQRLCDEILGSLEVEETRREPHFHHPSATP